MSFGPDLFAGVVLASVSLGMAAVPNRSDTNSTLSTSPPHHEEKVFYVSPKGKDRWSGEWAEPRKNEGPFATIGRARDAVRAFRQRQMKLCPIRVILRGG